MQSNARHSDASEERPRSSRRRRTNRSEGRSAPDQTQSRPSGADVSKQKNYQDRFMRPSLSQHGARRVVPTDRPDGATRRFSPSSTHGQPTPPRVPASRNPRIAEGRAPIVRRPSAPRPPRESGNGSANGTISRRRFSARPDNKYAMVGQIQEDALKNAPKPVVLGTGSRKLRIIPLGGAGETGAKNMTAFEYGRDVVVIDCGIGFPDRETPGVDALIPDVTYLEERKANIHGIVFTHGHEDHIGSVPYIWPKLNCPMYATPLTAGLIQHKLDEAGLKQAKLTIIEAGDKLHFGQISIEMVRLTHSIPDVLGLAIRCPAGLFFYATDWRLEHTPALGKPADWTRVAQLAGEGITALFSDSTNVDRPGYSPSEKYIGDAFDRVFQDAKGRIIIAQFASQINRIQQVINSAKRFGRKIAVSGRSMETYVNIAMNLGYLKVPEGMLVDIRKVNTLEPNRVAILSTGSQGEEYSSLTRISEGEHRHIKLEKTDTVVISASVVPGNEAAVEKVIGNLYREGVNVINNKIMTDIHVSGHPSREELKLMIALSQPRYFIPIHGDYSRLVEHGKLATELGVDSNNVIFMENGQVVEFDERGGRMTDERIQLNDVMIDGLGVGDVGPVVIRDRQTLGNEGMVTVFLVVKKSGELATSPDIITRGFIYVRESEELMNKLREEVKRSYVAAQKSHGTNWDDVRGSMRDDLSAYLQQLTGRNPMVIPAITMLQ